MTSRAIQVSVTHVAIALVIGSVIEGLLPKFNESASLQNHVFETLVQVGLNGAALGTVTGWLSENDPTYGIPFSTALYAAQPELNRRFENISDAVKLKVSQASLQMAPRLVV